MTPRPGKAVTAVISVPIDTVCIQRREWHKDRIFAGIAAIVVKGRVEMPAMMPRRQAICVRSKRFHGEEAAWAMGRRAPWKEDKEKPTVGLLESSCWLIAIATANRVF